MEIKKVTEHAILRYIERNPGIIHELGKNIKARIADGQLVKPRSENYNPQRREKTVSHIRCGKVVFVVSPAGVVITTLNYSPKLFEKVK